jgi:hypothetical protein
MTPRQLIGTALASAAGMSDGFLEGLAERLDAARNEFRTNSELLDIVRSAIAEFEPMLADHLAETVLSAWLSGYDGLSKLFPAWLAREFTESIRRGPPDEPPTMISFGDANREPRLRLLNVENAAKRLMERKILTRDEFDAAQDTATKQASFTIQGLGADTIDRMRGFLNQDLHKGTSLRSFRERVEENLGTSPIAPNHLENVYRTNFQSAMRDGRETLRSNPLVASAFPYQEYIPIHDARARPEHIALGELGLNETGIYSIADPVWDAFTPPWDFQCRCTVRLLTLEQAASKGVREAQEWIRTGRPPMQPEYRYALIPFQPKPGFGSRGNVGVIAMGLSTASLATSAPFRLHAADSAS